MDGITVKRNYPHFCWGTPLRVPQTPLEMSGIHEIAVNYNSAQFCNESHDKSRHGGETVTLTSI